MKVDKDVYLEHYGKKGMRWGVRNKKPQASGGGDRQDYKVTAKVKVRPNSFKDKAKRAGIKTGVGVSVAAAAVGGALVAKKLLADKGQVPVREISRTAFIARNAQGKIVEQIGDKLEPSTIRMLYGLK